MNIKKIKKKAIIAKKLIDLPIQPKAKTHKKRKVGRPRFKIDFDIVEKLATIHCTQEEIAHFVGCSVDTLQRNKEFCGIYKKGIDMGKISLRRHQWKLIDAGNCTMQIFIGKNILGQSDNPQDMDLQKVQNPVQIILSTDKKPKVYFKPKIKTEKESK